LPAWIDAFIEAAGHQTIIVIAGNKLDLEVPEVGFSEAEEWTKAYNYIIVETSAVTGAGIEALVREMSHEIARARAHPRSIGMSTETEPKPALVIESKPMCC
jgi:50S ribosomal subunit-associated GTPase HflX